MSGHRKSALLLHGISAKDKQWALSQVPIDDQRVLNEYLCELEDAGIPKDQYLLDTVINNRTVGAAIIKLDEMALQQLHKASASKMLDVLANEPQTLVLFVLALGDFHWHQGYMDALPFHQREKLRAISPLQIAQQDKLKNSLHLHILERLAALSSNETSRQGFEPNRLSFFKIRSKVLQLIRSTKLRVH